jgi:uncharacterized protein (DUF3084 family)
MSNQGLSHRLKELNEALVKLNAEIQALLAEEIGLRNAIVLLKPNINTTVTELKERAKLKGYEIEEKGGERDDRIKEIQGIYAKADRKGDELLNLTIRPLKDRIDELKRQREAKTEELEVQTKKLENFAKR